MVKHFESWPFIRQEKNRFALHPGMKQVSFLQLGSGGRENGKRDEKKHSKLGIRGLIFLIIWLEAVVILGRRDDHHTVHCTSYAVQWFGCSWLLANDLYWSDPKVRRLRDFDRLYMMLALAFFIRRSMHSEAVSPQKVTHQVVVSGF